MQMTHEHHEIQRTLKRWPGTPSAGGAPAHENSSLASVRVTAG